MNRPRLTLHRIPNPAAAPADVDGLIAEAESVVAATLTCGRLPATSRQLAELLGRVLQARLAAAARSAGDPDAATALARLAVAEQSLRTVIDRWNNRRSHALEWAIIALIAVDIVIAAL